MRHVSTISIPIGNLLTGTQLMRLVADFPQQRSGFKSRSGNVGFVLDKTALGQIFSNYFGFHCHSFHRLLHNHHHPSSGAGTVGQTVADVPNALSHSNPKLNSVAWVRERTIPTERQPLVTTFEDRGATWWGWRFPKAYRSRGPGSIPGATRFWEVVCLEQGPLSLVSTTEELLERKSSDSGLENRDYGRRDPSRWPRGTLYQ
jgi:hypothetical protein